MEVTGGKASLAVGVGWVGEECARNFLAGVQMGRGHFAGEGEKRPRKCSPFLWDGSTRFECYSQPERLDAPQRFVFTLEIRHPLCRKLFFGGLSFLDGQFSLWASFI